MGPTSSYLFPHDYVEGPMLWKRKSTYYVSYGSYGARFPAEITLEDAIGSHA
jgi:hypothetical protein